MLSEKAEGNLKQNAEKELARMQKVFDKIKAKDNKNSLLANREFLNCNRADMPGSKPCDYNGKKYFDFAKTYFEDGKYFFGKGKYLEAFEAAVIAWAYIDFGLKLGWFEVPAELKKDFTAD